MQRKHLWKKLAYLLMSVWLVSGMLLPTAAFADDKGKNATAAKPAQAQPSKQDDKKDDDKKAPAQTQTQQTESKSAVQTDDKKSDQQAAKQVGKPQGHSLSNPDGGGLDKPYDVGDKDKNSQANPNNTSKVSDGNNGCGQDKKVEAREDDFGQKHI
ncbi:MAG TPA: hypothetical protein VFN74_16830, partial [Chloroflexota bacterium]|nr:hypothetical protein [Chloroflexota bacterium]